MLLSVDIDNNDDESTLIKSQVTRSIAQAINNTKKIICVTGAGISVSAGIPDFRSADGLYSRILSSDANHNPDSKDKDTGKNPPTKNIKGKDFFDASFFNNPSTRPLFYKFLAELQTMCNGGLPTKTHKFLQSLAISGKLLRWYTQNIDGLEKQLGLTTSADDNAIKRPSVVALHGTLERLSCTMCRSTRYYDEESHALFLKGQSPSCKKCAAYCAERVANGRRAVKTGVMRPDIILYNEPHPHGELIAEYLHQDLARRPSLLLVIGTSLKVIGLKKIVKDIARTVHQDHGLVIFINKTISPRSEWKTIFDYELIGECDKWIELVKDECLLGNSTFESLSSPIGPKAKAETPKKDGRIDKMLKVIRRANRPDVNLKPENTDEENKKLGKLLANTNSPAKTSQLRDTRSCVQANSAS